MSVVLLCRDGLPARYLAHELADVFDAIVVERGGEARRRKLRREWRRTPWWKIPILALDLLALTVYGRLWSRFSRRRLAEHPATAGYPADTPLHYVEDANDAQCVALLEKLAPDVLVVLGTSILRAPVLAIPKELALNVHGGIVPAYRNVHSEVWAVLRDDVANVGTSLIHLDEGIDSGAVALLERVEGASGFFDLRWRNVELAPRLVREALRRHAEGTLPRTPQDDSSAGFYPTPGIGALARLALKSVGR